MGECIFCRIASGDSAAEKIYEDESMIAIMDHVPINNGHALVIPKKHVENLTLMDDLLAGEMFKVGRKVGVALKKSEIGCKGINFILSEGKEAGQEVFHAHLHVIPRHFGDGFGFIEAKHTKSSLEKLEATAAKIRAAMK
jgi:histidine triad (HIT) family protein